MLSEVSMSFLTLSHLLKGLLGSLDDLVLQFLLRLWKWSL